MFMNNGVCHKWNDVDRIELDVDVIIKKVNRINAVYISLYLFFK